MHWLGITMQSDSDIPQSTIRNEKLALRRLTKPMRLNLCLKGLQDPLPQLVPELRGNEVRELGVGIALVYARWQHVVIHGCPLLALQQETAQVGALGSVHQVCTGELYPVELFEDRLDHLIRGAGKLA